MKNGKLKVFSALFVLIAFVLAMGGSVCALNAEIDSVKLDGDELDTGLNQISDLQRDGEFPVKVAVTALEDLDNVQIEVMISGYDHDDRVTDVTDVFDMKENVTYRKTLNLKLPPRMEKDDQYRMRVYVRDRASDELQQEFLLRVSTERHSIVIRDIDLDPALEVEAGRSLRALVNVKNFGQMDEDNVKIEFSIPELGLRAIPDYVDIESDETKVSEELYLRVPVCAEAGQYAGQVKVTYDEGDEVETQNVYVDVVDAPAGCPVDSSDSGNDQQDTQDTTTPAPEGKTVIMVGADTQELVIGEGGAIYPVTFTNSGSETKTYTVSVTGVDDWAAVKVSPLQTVVVGAGESKSVFVYLSAKETASAGEHIFTVDVKDASGNIVKQIPMSANVVAGEDSETSESGLKRALEIGLIVLVVILIIVALIVLFTRRKDDDEEEAEDEISGQTYY